VWPQVKAGLRGELLFYDKFFEELKLEPLLDAGVKADLTGVRGGDLVNFDVTTNIEYKDIDKYVEIIQKRKKTYEIVLVNLKNEDFEFFPLRFPVCPKCGRFSHYILYLEPATTETCRWSDISDEQSIVQVCTKCKYFEDLKTLHFEVHSLSAEIDEMVSTIDVDESPRFSSKDVADYSQKASSSIVKFFERDTELLISGVAENKYVITDPRDASGYYDGLLHWKHPLAHDLSNYLGIYCGEYELGKSEAAEFVKDIKCKLCKQPNMRYNHTKQTLTCRRCGLIHDVSQYIKSLVTVGWEIKRVRKPDT